MAEKFTLTPEVDAALKALGHVDLTVGVTAVDRLEDTRDAIATAQAGLAQRFPGRSVAVLHVHAGAAPDAGGRTGTIPVLDLAMRPAAPGGATRTAALRVVLEASHRLGARGCAVIGSEVASLTPDWIGRLLAPVDEQEDDLVMPYYLRHPYSGAIITGIAYPLVRALYGRRVRYPLGTEFACSARLISKYLQRDPSRPPPGPQSLELQLQTDAVGAGLRICQAVLGPRTIAASDNATGLPALLLEVLSQLFGEMERTIPMWQKVRGSVPVELSGSLDAALIEPTAIDPRRLIEGFRLGQRNLRDVWGLMHSPATLVDLKRLAGLAEPQFAMPDALWARIVYDCSLAYHTRVMNREHLMGALAPLYLGWLGSLNTEMGDAEPARLEERLEQLCLRFEAEKPYLITRWRWPDRFNP